MKRLFDNRTSRRILRALVASASLAAVWVVAAAPFDAGY